MDMSIAGKSWGVETLSVGERHYKIIEAGVDQFGGNNEKGPVLEAYQMGVREYGEMVYRERFNRSAKRILRNLFRTGLFENPYLDSIESRKIAGCPEFVSAGFDTQVRSIVMLKNASPLTGKPVLPLAAKTRIYVPARHINASKSWVGMPVPARDVIPIPKEVLSEYFQWVDDPLQADCAICYIESPASICWREDRGYFPFSLQYRPYTALHAREKNIAGNDDRSYHGRTNTTENECDLDLILDTKKKMGDKPVIVFVKTFNPFIASEFEKDASAILLDFRVEPRALLEILSGRRGPSALLPFQMPADMQTVETQAEDAARDMRPYTDSVGNTWDYAFGLDWQGVINDARVKNYKEE
jgi:beta-glucosidase